jgi:hypothetical protein
MSRLAVALLAALAAAPVAMEPEQGELRDLELGELLERSDSVAHRGVGAVP